jgi:hypothetical protein
LRSIAGGGLPGEGIRREYTVTTKIITKPIVYTMKYKFKERDGMSKDTSTEEERKIIFNLLKQHGYPIYKTERHENCFANSGLCIHEDGEWLVSNYIDKNYTYLEMKQFILGNEQPQYEIY